MARARLPHAALPRRAGPRRLARRGLGGDADGARGRGAGLGPRPSGGGALAPRAPLAAGRGLGGPAAGLHRRRQRRAALDRLRGRQVPPHRRRAARGTAPAPCAPRCTTGPSPGRASAPGCRWCTRSAPPTPSSTTTAAPASSASCACSKHSSSLSSFFAAGACVRSQTRSVCFTACARQADNPPRLPCSSLRPRNRRSCARSCPRHGRASLPSDHGVG